jgi:hypothetical protein
MLPHLHHLFGLAIIREVAVVTFSPPLGQKEASVLQELQAYRSCKPSMQVEVGQGGGCYQA